MHSHHVLEHFSQAVTATDGERLASLFTKDGVYNDLVYGAVEGHDAIVAFMARIRRDGSDYRMELFDALAAEQIAYCRYRFSFVPGREAAAKRRIAVEGMAQFKFVGGLIAEFNEAANQGVTLVQLGLPAASIERVLHRWNDAMLGSPAMKKHLSDG